MRSCPERSNASSGRRTATIASASHGDPIVPPACTYASSGNEAAAPAPCSRVTSNPAAVSFPTVSGTRATLRSPGAVSRATPTLIAVNSKQVHTLAPRGALLHPPRAAAAVPRGDARVVRFAAPGRDRVDLLRRPRLAGELQHRRGDSDRNSRGNHRRQSRVLADRTPRRPRPLHEEPVPPKVVGDDAAAPRADHGASRREDGRLSPLRRGCAGEGRGGLGGGPDGAV